MKSSGQIGQKLHSSSYTWRNHFCLVLYISFKREIGNKVGMIQSAVRPQGSEGERQAWWLQLIIMSAGGRPGSGWGGKGATSQWLFHLHLHHSAAVQMEVLLRQKVKKAEGRVHSAHKTYAVTTESERGRSPTWRVTWHACSFHARPRHSWVSFHSK